MTGVRRLSKSSSTAEKRKKIKIHWKSMQGKKNLESH